MKRCDFSGSLVDNAGEVIIQGGKPVKIGHLLADAICALRNQAHPARMLTLAQAIYGATGPVDIDDADHEVIKKSLKDMGMAVIAAGQIERALDTPVEKSSK